MHFSLVYKKLECVDLKEKNRKQMNDQIKRRYNSRRKQNSLLFLNFVLKNFNSKLFVKKIWFYKKKIESEFMNYECFNFKYFESNFDKTR